MPVAKLVRDREVTPTRAAWPSCSRTAPSAQAECHGTRPACPPYFSAAAPPGSY
jgi:hypothetical protein